MTSQLRMEYYTLHIKTHYQCHIKTRWEHKTEIPSFAFKISSSLWFRTHLYERLQFPEEAVLDCVASSPVSCGRIEGVCGHVRGTRQLQAQLGTEDHVSQTVHGRLKGVRVVGDRCPSEVQQRGPFKGTGIFLVCHKSVVVAGEEWRRFVKCCGLTLTHLTYHCLRQGEALQRSTVQNHARHVPNVSLSH